MSAVLRRRHGVVFSWLEEVAENLIMKETFLMSLSVVLEGKAESVHCFLGFLLRSAARFQVKQWLVD